jgi:hypothetical protein
MNPSVTVRHDAIWVDLQHATATALQTCINLSHLHTAVEILEQGLATIFQQMLQQKIDVHRLPPDQATKFMTLSAQLYSRALADPINIIQEKNILLKNIRKQLGLACRS